MRRIQTRVIVVAFLFLFALCASAQINTIRLTSPGYAIEPGELIEARLEFDLLTQVEMSSYYFKIEYNTDYLTLENVFPDTTNLDWLYPTSSENANGQYAELVDQSASPCSIQGAGTLVMAHLLFRAKTSLPPGLVNNVIHINSTYSTVWNCGLPNPQPNSVSYYEDAFFSSFTFQQTTFGVEQYLDMDGNTLGAVGDGDIDVLRDIVLGKRYDTTGQFTLKVGGLQGDINGNAEVDYYDLGYMDAVARTIRFIHAGPDGVCNTTANTPPPSNPEDADDIQETPVGQGEPHALVIDGDTGNAVLESTRGGDDTIEGNLIFSGANGKAESTASGDDEQLIPYGQGAPGTICVSPGDNGYLATTKAGDDVVLTDPRPVGDLLAATPMAGVPAKIVLIYPNAPDTYYDHMQQVPITVSVQTEDGFPKSGLAPVFTAQGGGYFQGSGSNIIQGWVSDNFLDRGEVPSGNVTVLFNPTYGDNVIEVMLPGNTGKGVPNIYAETIHIVVLNSAQGRHPNTMSFSPDVSIGYVNEPLGLTMTLKEGQTVAPGFANNLYLISQRNMLQGAGLSQLSLGNYNTIFYDDFETGSFEEPWVFNDICGAVGVNGTKPGLFGTYGVQVHVSTPGECTLQTDEPILTNSFSDIMVQFQWAWEGPAVGNFKAFWSSDGSNWQPFMEKNFGDQPPQNYNKMVSEGFNLSGFSEIENNKIYLKFTVEPIGPNIFNVFLDNVQVTGKHQLLYENFNAYSVGQFPSSMDPSGWITTGPDGICQTPASASDQELIAVGNGKANVVYVFPGKDLILDSIAGGDDQLNIIDNTITTGANGIAETIVPESDFTIIPYGQGWPFAIAIEPGSDNVLDSYTVNEDDERQDTNGPYPQIMVDNSISGQGPGANKFLLIGRSENGANKDSYAVRKIVNLENWPDAALSFKYMTAGMGDSVTVKQMFVVEVSDNGGKTFIPVWDFMGTEVGDWSQVEIKLTDDARFNVSDNFIIQWRATMDSKENDSLDPDAVYLDEITIFAAAPPPDKFTPVIDLYNGNGNYQSNLLTLAPGNTIKIAAVYFSDNNPPLFSNAVQVAVNMRKVDPNSIKILPEQFELKACKSQTVNVVGHYLDLPGELTEDITSLFKLVVEGPAKQTAPGVITMDCYRGPDPLSSDPVPFNIRAIPLVPGLLDPVSEGGGIQTGNIGGRVYKPTYTGADNASIVIDMGASGKIYSKTDISGYYTVIGVPVGISYAVDGSRFSYTLSHKTSITVTAGLTTTVNPILGAGANCDGDAYMDTSDTDDDADGVADTSEPTTDCRYKPDCDGDGYPDNTDKYPTNPLEWADTDNDGIGDNADTDDDNDTILDSEEIITGADGYITNKASADTDADLMSDPYEISYGLNPTVNDAALDKDGDGKRNYDEYLRGTNPKVSEPACGEGAFCVADSDGNGLVEVPDLSALGVLLGGTPASWTQVIPQNGDQMDLDGNGIIEVPDYSLLLSVLVQNLGGNLPGQPDAVNLESSQNVTISNGQWTKITVNLTSQATAGAKKRSGYGVIFYKSSYTSGGAGEFWGGDKASTSRSGGRWYTTRTMVSESGRAEIWFKATHTGHVYIQAEVPASASKYVQQVQLVTPVHITIN